MEHTKEEQDALKRIKNDLIIDLFETEKRRICIDRALDKAFLLGVNTRD